MKNEESVDRIIQVNNIDIGKNIAKLRKAMNIKQTDMVAKLQTNGVDISIYSYNRIEKGTQNPTVLLLYACCHILDCDMNRIFDFKSWDWFILLTLFGMVAEIFDCGDYKLTFLFSNFLSFKIAILMPEKYTGICRAYHGGVILSKNSEKIWLRSKS